jgi:hypothetical protein
MTGLSAMDALSIVNPPFLELDTVVSKVAADKKESLPRGRTTGVDARCGADGLDGKEVSTEKE